MRHNQLLADLTQKYIDDPNFELLTDGRLNIDLSKYTDEERADYWRRLANCNRGTPVPLSVIRGGKP